jgi:hypothetical protein
MVNAILRTLIVLALAVRPCCEKWIWVQKVFPFSPSDA